MASHSYSLHCKNASRYPHVSRVPIEKNNVDFIYQFVKDYTTLPFDSFDYWNSSTKYIRGPPTKFPNYGDFPKTYSISNCEKDISLSPWRREDRVDYKGREIPTKYLEITFHEAVYPLRVSVYEIYNPGCITKICAEYSENTWCPLWIGKSQTVPSKARLFSPPLHSNNFKTKKLRIYFKYSKWNYCTMLDAVMIIGTSKMISPRNSTENLTELLRKINCKHTQHEDIHNLTPDYENANFDIEELQNNFHKYCINDERCKLQDLLFIDVPPISQKESHCLLEENPSNHAKCKYCIIGERCKIRELFIDVDASPISQTKSHRLLEENSSNHAKCKLTSENLTHCSFSTLSDEIILKILNKLDLTTLSRMSQVNKHLNNLTQDPFLYTCLNMRNLSESAESLYISNIFRYFEPKCKYLKQLDLTNSYFSDTAIIQFINNCGKYLTHFRLRNYGLIKDSVIRTISKKCKNLKELDLRHCRMTYGFSYLKDLTNLEYLDLCVYWSTNTKTLYEILQRNQQMRELRLFIDCNTSYTSSLERFNNVISEITNALANYKNLRKVTLLTEDTISDDSLAKCLSCQCLKEVHLTFNTLSDRHLRLLTQCKNLEYLYLYHFLYLCHDREDASLQRCTTIFELCPRVKFYFVNCEISSSLAEQWMEKYPHVFIKNTCILNEFMWIL